ncbi:hypothetical protein [Tenacibaculum xiamenense]|uniref:hypothetical protein n=1 Tax=Tenacibaculum xiamenense TaxID=1261553 RepID=UPI003894CB37
MKINALEGMRLKLWVSIITLVLTIIIVKLKLIITPSWFSGALENNHKLLLDFNFTNNEQSRLFQFFIPEFFITIFKIDIIKAYILQRALFTFLTFFAFFYFCKKWFNNIQSFICVFLFGLVMIFTFKNHLQESAALLSLTFLLTLWLIRDKKDWLFALVLVIGSINNETILFVPAIYFFYNFDLKKSVFKLSMRTILLALPAFIVVGIIRYINIDRPHLGGAWHLIDNLQKLDRLIFIYNIFWILPFIYFKRKNLFLRRSLLTFPLFIIPHLITGIISETRQMLPLGFIIIPASMFTLLDIIEKRKQKRLLK